MPPKVQKTYQKRVNENSPQSSLKNSSVECEKENIYLKLRKREKKVNGVPFKYQDTNSDSDFEKLLSSPIKQRVHLKPLSFWSKKLQDLESVNNAAKKKCALYELSDLDETFSPNKKRKNIKKRVGVKKKKKEGKIQINCNKLKTKLPESKIKAHERSLLRERIMINREKEKLSVKNDNFTFSTVMPSLGVTSTPAANKVNLIGASNFMFLSPLAKENGAYKIDEHNIVDLVTPQKLHSKGKTPKKNSEEKGMNNKRVLRSRKLLG